MLPLFSLTLVVHIAMTCSYKYGLATDCPTTLEGVMHVHIHDTISMNVIVAQHFQCSTLKNGEWPGDEAMAQSRR